jgi:hypothetical protein
VTTLTDKEKKSLHGLWQKTGGKAFEPVHRHPAIVKLIDSGCMKWVDARCGFERMKDAMLAWTDAGAEAMRNFK